jgi:hypothetical protein
MGIEKEHRVVMIINNTDAEGSYNAKIQTISPVKS